ncbi:MAG: CDP-alcohol phosphatidyltransferase family protein [Deltaproteobacteria bacterium]|nr:MAG: CDP-alcohol phosphatidyltransferase family protein [Deltaproteobacteria bacterium]
MLVQLVNRYPGLRKRIVAPFVVDVNPNIVSTVALVCAVFSGYFFFSGMFLLAAFFLFLNGFLDIVDGEIAKSGKWKQTKRGDFIDHTFDRVSDVFIFVGIAYNPLMPRNVVFLTLVCLILVSYLGTQAQALTKERFYGGIAGRSDRHVVLFFGAVAECFVGGALLYSVYLIFALSFVTFLQRFRSIYKMLE